MLYVFLAIAAFGHAILWVAAVNRLHGTAVNRRLKTVLTGLSGLGVSLIPLALAYVAIRAWRVGKWPEFFSRPDESVAWLVWAYLVGCAIVCVSSATNKLWLLAHPERHGVLLSNHTEELKIRGSIAELTAPGLPALFARLPGNEILRPRLQEKQLAITNLTAAHDGLRIAHLTDLHISGRISKRYFEQVVEHVNDARPDIIAITGDIIEREPCIAWIPDTLGHLSAPGGVYFVLGNHDRHVDRARLTSTLTGCGLIHLGGRTTTLRRENNVIVLAGNELPWSGPAPNMPQFANKSVDNVLQILLAHTPDQIDWAQAHDFDLMLAGHNHGGQVCVPLLGPVLVPSRHGTRYAGGVFSRGNTVLHVGRGTSSLSPIRYNCPPEVSILVLRRSA